jgi:hypothetical protein
MSYGPFYAARDKVTGKLFTSLRGKQVFNSKGSLSNALGQRQKRERLFNRSDVEVFEISMIDTDRLNKLLEAEKWANSLEAAGVDNWDGISYAYELMGELE